MAHILVTGGAGFIGSHVVDKLIDNNQDVIVFDNLSTGKRKYVNKKSIFIKGDIKNLNELEKVFKKYELSAVLHIAGQPSIVNSFTDPLNDINTNFVGTVNITQLCLKYKVKRLIYASSMTIYGNQKKLPISESANANPINYYGVAKFASERFVHITSERIDLESPLNVTSLRMFNVYGPRQSLTNPYQGVLAIFLGNVLRSEPITIFGDGKQGRDFVYVEDVAKVWVRVINNKKSFGRVYNIGYGKQTSIMELAMTVIKSCGYDPKKYTIIRKPGRSGDQRYIESDIKIARREIHFTPSTDLENGIRKTLNWAKKEL
jgi:UDP-glucose 4-epimerase